jgi:hypothetical protein
MGVKVMKAKKILIVYGNSGKGFASKEKMFNQVINELVSEGRVVASTSLTPTEKSVVFDDGSKVSVVRFGMNMVGARITHLYIDSSIFEIHNGTQYVNEVLKPTVIPSGNYQHLDAQGTQSDRIFVY